LPSIAKEQGLGIIQIDHNFPSFATERTTGAISQCGQDPIPNLRDAGVGKLFEPLGQIDYEDFIRSARALGGAEEARECFRRAVFNLLTTNRDDPGRNHAFLYHEVDRTWTLSPAYDLNPNVATVLIALTWLGSAEIPARFDQLIKLAEIGGIAARMAKSIYEEVEAATLGGWQAAARYADVPENIAAIWEKEMLQQTKSLRDDARRGQLPRRKRSKDRS
jgi:serine/threonine-protein kinase HipA